MILSLFLPYHIGSYYLFARKIVGIEITKNSIHAVIMILKGRSRIIEHTYTERFSGNGSLDEQIIQALKNLKLKLGDFHEIYGTISSSHGVFKELTLPFIGEKKVKIVVPFEVESQLPFNLAEGVVDAVITGIDKDEQKTSVLVTAIKQEVVERYEGYFLAAELPLHKLSISIVELYSLYEALEGHQPSVVLLVEIGLETTIGLIVDGRLKYIRTLQKGIKNTSTEVIFDKATQDQLASLFDDIRLTLDAALQKIAPGRSLGTLVITGALTDVPEHQEIKELAKNIAPSVEFFDPKKLLEKGYSSKLHALPGLYMPSIALCSTLEKTDTFNLLQEKAQEEENRRITNQLITIGALTVGLVLTFASYSFFRVRALRQNYKISEQEAINELKKQFKLPTTKTQRLDIANKAAQSELHKQETAWKRLSPENRYAYVTYLAELTKCINMKESQLQLDSIIIKDDTVKLYGSVPGYQQLTRLQDQLDCPLFKKVPKLQAFNFKSEPITLVINPEALHERV